MRIAQVTEVPLAGEVPRFVHPGWEERFPWLVQGMTAKGGAGADPFDLRLFGPAPSAAVQERWELLRRESGCSRVVHSRQLHGAAVTFHPVPPPDAPPGLLVGPDGDGHLTRSPGLLLAVATADCVPVYVVEPGSRAVALLHAGWRGAVAGIVEAGVGALRERMGAAAPSLHVHLGPAVCGECYEVGAEVFRALELPEPSGPAPVDLRAALAERVLRCGVRPQNLSVSSHCTRCAGSPFFSHRGGDRGRQVAILGIREGGGG